MKNEYIANPFRTAKGEKFNYSPNHNAAPFHIYVGTSGWVAMNLLCFAKDEAEAKQLLIEATKHSIDNGCFNEEKAKIILQFLETGEQPVTGKHFTIIIQQAPKNQFYKISWADNDNIY